MRASLDWEYALLSPEERRLFARLSVFVGGGYLEAIEAVCGWDHDQTTDVLTGVASLVKKSLLIQKEGVGGEPRFAMLETIREYATEKLEERGEVQEMQRRHAVYFLQFAERIRPLLDGPGQVDGLNLLDEERANGRAVMDWACEQGELEIGLRMAIAAEYLHLRGYGAEAWGWFERLLARIWEEGQTMKVEAAVASALLEGAGVFRIAC
jgi:non-specific serine/threonine protein kinase